MLANHLQTFAMLFSPVAYSPRPAKDEWLSFKLLLFVHAIKLYQDNIHLDSLSATCTVNATGPALRTCIS